MTETTVFTQADQPVVEQTQVAPQPTIPTEVAEFVGQGKKYQSVEDALKAIPHAQQHISTIEQENAALRAELEKRRTAEELLADIKQGVTNPGQPPKVDLNQEVVSEIVRAALSQEKQKEKAQANVQTVTTTFTQAFGDKAEEAFIKLAGESGMSVSQLNQLAMTSPDAVLKLAGLKKQTTPVPTVLGNVNSLAVTQTQQPKELSARLPKGATTRDVNAAWEIAKQKVQQKLQS